MTVSSPDGPDAANRAERQWAIASIALIAVVLGVVAFTGIHWASMPPSGIEPIDPTTLHVAGEFVEQNLGAQVRADGAIIVRLIGQQYSFNPQIVVVPCDRIHFCVGYRTETGDKFRGGSNEVERLEAAPHSGARNSLQRLPDCGEASNPIVRWRDSVA